MEIFIHNLALGQLIQVLSLLLHVNPKTTIITPSPWFALDLAAFKTIFNISNDQLVIEQSDVVPNNLYGAPGDHAKPLSPYIKPTQVNLFGKNFPTNKRNKPCIGIAMAKNASELKKLLDQGVPGSEDSRYHDFSVYEKIIKLVLDSGYDVITLNIRTSLEEKVYQVSQLCDCVITYEGGMSHLAHCFDVPCIMLPWQQRFWMPLEEQHPLLDTTYRAPLSRAEIMHLDKSTYFLESADEILSWTPDDLRRVITELYNKQGNSKLLTKETVDSINSNSGGLDLLLIVGNTDEQTRRIINDHMSKYALGGYEEFNLFNSVA